MWAVAECAETHASLPTMTLPSADQPPSSLAISPHEAPPGAAVRASERMPASGAENALGRSGRWVWAVLLLVALILQVQAQRQQSLTGDGGVHLIAGHQALRYGENLVNWEHPPLVKLIAAIPAALRAEQLLPPLDAKDTFRGMTQLHEQAETMLAATFAGRALVQILIVLPALFACFWLGKRFHSPECGLVLTLLLTLSFSSLPTLAILQTDGGALLGYAATTCLCLRYLDRPTLLRALGVGFAFGVGMASKYSALLLAPTLLLTFVLAQNRGYRRINDALVAGLGTLLVLGSVYGVANRNLSIEANSRVIEQYMSNQATLVVKDELRKHEELVTNLAKISPSLSQFAVGFLGIRAQNQIGVYPSYALGKVSSQGRWWYFPLLALVKVPVAVLVLLLLLGAAQWRYWRRIPKVDRAVVASAVLVYLLVAFTSNYNIGFRHLLPVTPLLLLPLAMVLADRLRLAVGLLAVLALESLLIAPLWISSTNSWWLDSNNPSRFWFSGGNLEFSQNFLTLAQDLPKDQPVGFLFPGKDTTTLAAYAPGAWSIPPGTTELEPGLYVVSVLVEQYLPAVPRSTPEEVHGYEALLHLVEGLAVPWQLIKQGEDLGYVAGTFHLYRLPAVAQTPGSGN